jgi:hypothetical protein
MSGNISKAEYQWTSFEEIEGNNSKGDHRSI